MNTKLASIAAAIFAVIGAPVLRAGAVALPGEQRRWALHFRVRLEQAGGERPIEVDLTGDWVSTITTVRAGEYDAALEVVNARIHGGTGRAAADAGEQLLRRLARRFWVTYSEDGLLVAVHFHKDMNPSDRNLLQLIATESQFVRAASDRVTWTVLERDGGGQYLSIYSRSAAGEVVKRKLKYMRTDGAPGVPAGGIQVDIDQSELRFAFDASGEILSLDGINQVRLAVAVGNAAQLTTMTETHLAGLRKSQAPELIGSLERARPEVVSLPVVTHKPDPDQIRAQADAQLIGGRTTQALLDAALTNQDEHLLPERLAAVFRQRADAPAAALAMLRKNGARKRITDALGSAGSPPAIDALGAIARDQTLARPLRIDALSALILVQHPSVEAMRLPLAFLDDPDPGLASAARIVSGALARAGRSAHAGQAGEIDTALIARYRKAQGSEQIAGLLAALGNSAGPAVLPVAVEALGDSRETVRAEAVRALRFADGPEIDGLLAARITEDRDQGVRGAAVFAAGFRPPIGPKVAEALMRAAKSDSALRVRARAISVLRQNPNSSPRIAETLTWVAGHDSEAEVRRLAQEALAPGR